MAVTIFVIMSLNSILEIWSDRGELLQFQRYPGRTNGRRYISIIPSQILLCFVILYYIMVYYAMLCYVIMLCYVMLFLRYPSRTNGRRYISIIPSQILLQTPIYAIGRNSLETSDLGNIENMQDCPKPKVMNF